ncbi:uncharacterized protein [Amphiura filiformis]|uniref:uncharacterized protein n=1 Tax=Amphiura filiformis TaxID=82378 RepID=UPI003B20E359
MDRRKAYAKHRSVSEGNMFSALNTKAAKLGNGHQMSPTARSPLMSPFLGLRRMLSRESGRWSPGTTRKADAKRNSGSGSPKPKKKRFYGVCRACGFDVMTGDQISVRQWVFHRDCFKCSRCDQPLSLKFYLQRYNGNE